MGASGSCQPHPAYVLAVLQFSPASLAARGQAHAADAALIEAAKKEGKVVWYTTLIVNQAIRPLKDAFEKKYPGIELQYARADEAPTAAKILAEAQAGRVQADVFDGISNMVPLKRAGIVAPYRAAVGRQNPGRPQGPGRLLDRDPALRVRARHQHHAGAEGAGAEDLSGPARSDVAGQDGLEPGLDRGRASASSATP